jgi:hypothetical protein
LKEKPRTLPWGDVRGRCEFTIDRILEHDVGDDFLL